MKSFIGIIAVFTSLNVLAAQSLSTKISGPYSSIRALGMGNAFTAVADDTSLILYNPAGFAVKKHNEFQLSLVGAGVSNKTITIANDIDKASQTTGTDEQKAQAISDVLDKYYGQSLGGKVQALELFWVRKNWGFAFLPADVTIDMTINRQLGPAIDLNIKGDSTFAFGYGTDINKYLDVGLTAKYVHRVSVEQTVSALELATNSNVLSEDRLKEGTTTDFDIGFLYRPNWFNTKASVAAPVPEPEVVIPATPETKTEAAAATAASGDATTAPEAVKTEDEKRAPQAEAAPVAIGSGDTSTVKVEVKKEDKVAVDVASGDASATKEEAKAVPAKTETETVVAATPPEDEKFPLTFGLVLHNAMDGKFTLSKIANKKATEVPTQMYRVIDVGMQYLLRDGEDFKIRYTLDFKNLMHPEATFNKSVGTGLEFDYSPSTWFKTQIRGGMNQMYYTAGATFLFGIFNFDLATYGEEVGSATSKIENRVYAAKVAFNF